jgi:CSLREA domain-containing protein
MILFFFLYSLARAATITVDTTADDSTVNNNCTFREAIEAANENTAVDGCPAGDPGSDRIDLTGLSGAIFLNFALPEISEDLTITGPGPQNLLIDANGNNASIIRANSSSDDQTVNMTGLRLTGGRVLGYGGAVYVYPGDTVNLTACRIDDNQANMDGGGIENDQGTVVLTDCILSSNTAVRGGAVFNINGTLKLVNTLVSDNEATNQGGGIYNYSGTAMLTDSTVTGNTSQNDGGGIFNNSTASMTLTECFVGNNSATAGNGGGIDNSGDLTLTQTTVNGNSTFGTFGGAGIFNNGSIMLDGSTISGNTGRDAVFQQGTAVLTNSTISGNTGAGFSNSCAVGIETELIHCTVAFNTKGGLSTCGRPLRLKNTIAAHNTSYDCSGATSPSGCNLDSDNSCGLTGPCNLPGTDPLIGALRDNGGPTRTHALLSGSPAIDGGDNASCPDTDQRGVLRPWGKACDIGAFEYKPAVMPAIPLLLFDD